MPDRYHGDSGPGPTQLLADRYDGLGTGAMAATDPDAAAQPRREVLPRRLVSGMVETAQDLYGIYREAFCPNIEEALGAYRLRRPEGHGQAPHDLISGPEEPSSRMCYDYNHAIKYWEIDE